MLKRYKSKTHDLWIEIFDEVIPERYCVNIESWENGVMIDEIAIGKVLNLMECIGCSKDDIVDMATAHIDIIEPKTALGV